jgi:NADH-quinone oxidoreductase subunit M
MGLLSLAIWTPIAFGLVLLAFGRDDQAQVTRWIALLGALVSFLITLPLYAQFDNASAAMQFAENLPWIELFNVNSLYIGKHSFTITVSKFSAITAN